MKKYERLKSTTIQFSIEMNKTRFSEVVLDDITKAGIDTSKLKILSEDIDSKERLKELKQFINAHKQVLKRGLHDYCLEEYREIKEDLKFRNSKDGKLIIELESWVQENRESIPELLPAKVFIGRSFDDPKKLIIGGILNGQQESRIIDFFETKRPPVEPEYNFENE